MGFAWTLPVRGVQLFFSIVVLGISAYLVDQNSYASANFMLFTSLWTIVMVVFLGLADMGTIGDSGLIGMASLVIEFLSWVFWLSGWAALADHLDKSHCGPGTHCTHLRADVAFGVMTWVLFTATLGFVAFGALRGGRGGMRKPGAPGGVA